MPIDLSSVSVLLSAVSEIGSPPSAERLRYSLTLRPAASARFSSSRFSFWFRYRPWLIVRLSSGSFLGRPPSLPPLLLLLLLPLLIPTLFRLKKLRLWTASKVPRPPGHRHRTDEREPPASANRPARTPRGKPKRSEWFSRREYSAGSAAAQQSRLFNVPEVRRRKQEGQGFKLFPRVECIRALYFSRQFEARSRTVSISG